MLGFVYLQNELDSNQFFINRLLGAAATKGITAKVIDVTSALSHLGTEDTAVVRTHNPLLAQALEASGVRVLNPSPIAILGNDKLRLATWCHTHGIPHPTTRPASQWWREPRLECVLKPRYGHGGKGVQLTEVPRLACTDQWIIQSYMPEAREDFRSWILGNEIVATLKRTAPPGDFRTNISVGATARVAPIPNGVRELTTRVMRLLPVGYYGIDIAVGIDGPAVIEIEDTVGARSLYSLNICDPASLLIEWIVSSASPTTHEASS